MAAFSAGLDTRNPRLGPTHSEQFDIEDGEMDIGKTETEFQSADEDMGRRGLRITFEVTSARICSAAECYRTGDRRTVMSCCII